MNKVDKAIATLEFMLRDKERRLDQIARQIEISENDKIKLGRETEFNASVRTLIKSSKDEINRNMGKLPPQALDIEKSVIGGMLLEKQGQIATKFVNREHFYIEAHQIIFDAIMAVMSRNEEISLITVRMELSKNGQLERVGGAYYLAELMSAVVNTHNTEWNCRVLIEKAIKRELTKMSGELLHRCYADEDCFEILEYGEETFKQIKSWIK